MVTSTPLSVRIAAFAVDPLDRALIEDCLATLDPASYSIKTRQKYQLNMLEFAEWLHARGLNVSEAKPKHVKQYVVYLAGAGRAAIDAARPPERRLGWQDNLAASTRKGQFAAIRTLYKHLVFDEQLDRDPTYGMKAPKVEIKRGLVLDGDEVRAILDARGGARCRVQAFLLAFTLARLGSIAGLRWTHVDFEGEIIYFDVAKFGDAYAVPMKAELKIELLRWQRAQRLQALGNEAVAKSLARPDAHVLLTDEGKAVNESTIAKQIKFRARRAGVALHDDPTLVSAENTSAVSPHTLRRSGATLLRRNGMPIEDVADLLHHSGTQTALRHYAFTSTPRQREVVDGLSY